MRYADAVRIAIAVDRPLLTFVGCKPFDVDGCISCRADTLPGYSPGSVVISTAWAGSSSGHVEMGVVPNPTAETIKAALPKRVHVGDKFEWQRIEPAKQAVAARTPIGHTHSCPQHGTWDHVSNPSHNCPVCGREVLIQDNPPRIVNLFRQSKPVLSAVQFQSDCPTCPNYRPR